MDEITKVLDCLVKQDIATCIRSKNIRIDKEMASLEVLSTLLKFRENNNAHM